MAESFEDRVMACLMEAVESAAMLPGCADAVRATLNVPEVDSLWVALPLWSGRVVATNEAVEAVVGAALLLARGASAVLDDVQDQDTGDALWRELGIPQAINVGVALAFAGQAALDQLRALGVDPAIVAAAQADYARVIMAMCSGQYAELAAASLSPEEHDPPTLDEYYDIVIAKTTSFCSLSCRLAARVVGASEEVLDRLTLFGHEIGLMHQMYNDHAALHEDKGKKDIGRAWTFPPVYTWQVGDEDERRLVAEAWLMEDSFAMEAVTFSAGAIHYMILVLDDCHEIAIGALDELAGLAGDEAAIARLRQLADNFMDFGDDEEWDEEGAAEEGREEAEGAAEAEG